MDLVVAADDRTGAFETAAALADRGAGPVTVRVWPSTAVPRGTSVVDLGSRHVAPIEAARRAASMETRGQVAHKIDSTLRGNWADELVARSAAMPVLLVPSLPAAGRVCVGGIVLHDGRPVHLGDAGSDVRRGITSSCPQMMLGRAGASSVMELATLDQVHRWCARPAGIAVADAADDASIDAIVEQWSVAAGAVLLAGTSAVIGATAGPVHTIRMVPMPSMVGPIVVVCGSLHPVARRQMQVAERAGVAVTSTVDDVAIRRLRRTGVLMVTTELPVAGVDDPLAVAAAGTLAGLVARVRTEVEIGVLVVIGGDTAAAVLDAADVAVHGSIGDGAAWAVVDGFVEPVVTRSGGFGDDDALLHLLRTTLAP